MTNRAAVLLTAAIAAVGSLAAAPPASDTATPTETAPPSLFDQVDEDLVQRHTTLTGAVLGLNADREGLTLPDYLQQRAASLPGLTNSPSGQLLTRAGLQSATVSDFDRQLALARNRIAISGGQLRAWSDADSAPLLDRAVVADGAASLLERARAAAGNPASLDRNAGLLSSMPPEAAAFGVAYRDAVAEMATSGLLADADRVRADFDKIRQSAMTSAQATMAAANPSPCVTALFTSMGTGRAVTTTPDCAPCAIAGAFGHSQLDRLIGERQGGSQVSVGDGGVSLDLNNVDSIAESLGWADQFTNNGANGGSDSGAPSSGAPSSGAPTAAGGPSGSTCQAASAATTEALTALMPRIVSGL